MPGVGILSYILYLHLHWYRRFLHAVIAQYVFNWVYYLAMHLGPRNYIVPPWIYFSAFLKCYFLPRWESLL